ncbi:hypothetical protein [Caulobacter segnis]|uniref:17 kDa surface antigen n=1 Tax=Caulobacter segnis TaxID=88688 RepID=A0A2W5UXY4_9CAUL|nr:hypothetical protein [Caulobacter segnis]PZR31387.1 MAG: hypothetical protein DI526_19770 [Caulobacter segnis]
MVRKIVNTLGRVGAGVAALSLVAAATTASADPRYYHRYHKSKGDDVAVAAIAAGVLGLAVGAALSDNDRRDRYDDRYYGRRAYAPPSPPPPRAYGYGYGYAPRPYYGDRECWTTREYDRWSGSYYERTVCR